MFIMQTIRKWVECNKVITCHCSYLFVCLYFCMHFCISEHLCARVYVCVCVFMHTWGPFLLPAWAVESLSLQRHWQPIACLSKRCLIWWSMSAWSSSESQPMKWKYHLIIPDQITSFITHDLTIYGAYNAVESRETFPGQTEIIGWLRRMFAPAEETKG